MTAIKSHLAAIELEHRYKTASEAIAKSHFHALWLLARGYSIDQVAGLLSFASLAFYPPAPHSGAPAQSSSQPARRASRSKADCEKEDAMSVQPMRPRRSGKDSDRRNLLLA